MPGRPTPLAYGRAGACCACSRCGTGRLFLLMLFFFISSILSSFSYASSLGRRLDILKYEYVKLAWNSQLGIRFGGLLGLELG